MQRPHLLRYGNNSRGRSCRRREQASSQPCLREKGWYCTFTRSLTLTHTYCTSILKHTRSLQLCDKCSESTAHCTTCQARDKVFIGDDALEQFCVWLFSAPNKGCIAIAHNARGLICFERSHYHLQYLIRFHI